LHVVCISILYYLYPRLKPEYDFFRNTWSLFTALTSSGRLFTGPLAFSVCSTPSTCVTRPIQMPGMPSEML